MTGDQQGSDNQDERRIHGVNFRSPDTDVVGSPGGVSPPGSHRSRRDSLPSPGSSQPRCQNSGTHRQCAKKRGYWPVVRCHAACAFLKVLSRLYFFLIQRTR